VFDSSPPPGFPTPPRSFALREFFAVSQRALARLEKLQAEQDAALLVADERVVTLDAEQLTRLLPGCSQPALQNAATALAAAGFEGALRDAMRYTDARELPPGHFAGVGAGLPGSRSRAPVRRCTVAPCAVAAPPMPAPSPYSASAVRAQNRRRTRVFGGGGAG
jgi:hypothetical protein